MKWIATGQVLMVVCAVLWFFAPLDAAGALFSRELNCAAEATPRARSICQSLEAQMRWEWFGHATVSPGYRVVFQSVRKTFCSLPIHVDDTATLVAMALAHRGAGARDLQIGNGARWLLFLLGPPVLESFPEPLAFPRSENAQAAAALQAEIALTLADPAMIWNPANAGYPLRGGCK